MIAADTPILELKTEQLHVLLRIELNIEILEVRSENLDVAILLQLDRSSAEIDRISDIGFPNARGEVKR